MVKREDGVATSNTTLYITTTVRAFLKGAVRVNATSEF